MSSLQLISHHLCPYVQRAAIVLAEKKIPYERTYIDLAYKPSWFVDLSPLGKVPVLITEGTVLFESQVIADYLNEVTPNSLYPALPLQKARHRAWIAYASETLTTIGGFYNATTETVFNEKIEQLRVRFEKIETEIVGPYFDGTEFHLIDGVWATIFRYFDAFDQIADFGILANSEKIQTWRNRISERPSVVAAVPDGYSARLMTFLENRNSYISTLIEPSSLLK